MEVKDRFNSDLSGLDLTECESILKKIYHIDIDAELIILKFVMDDGVILKYDVYDPYTRQKLNLSYCENTKAKVYVPYAMDEKTEELYNSIKEQGYDPLDEWDKFYKEICTPYTSENGTDVLLDDREEFIYTSLVNASLCPSGCNYSEFYVQKKFIKWLQSHLSKRYINYFLSGIVRWKIGDVAEDELELIGDGVKRDDSYIYPWIYCFVFVPNDSDEDDDAALRDDGYKNSYKLSFGTVYTRNFGLSKCSEMKTALNRAKKKL
jgi:hypothetical protein